MLIGTSCRFSVRLRAVTTTSSRVDVEDSVDASAARAGATCIVAAPERVAAIARLSRVGEGNGGVGTTRVRLPTERTFVIRIASSPYLEFRGTLQCAFRG